MECDSAGREDELKEMNSEDSADWLNSMGANDDIDDVLDEIDRRRLKSRLVSAQRDGDIPEVVSRLSPQDKMESVFVAARYKLYGVVLHLLNHGVDLHYIDSEKNNLLHIVLGEYWEHDNYSPRLGLVFNDKSTEINPDELLQCVVRLVQAHVDINQLNETRQTPLFIAARNHLNKVVIYLLEQGAGVHYVDIHHKNVLHTVLDFGGFFAFFGGCCYFPDMHRDKLPQCVIELVGAGVDVNHMDKDKQTPIFTAAMGHLYKVVIYLINQGANVHHVDIYRNNIIHTVLDFYILYPGIGTEDLCDVANLEETLHCVVKLVEAGVDVNHPNGNKQTPIFIAARKSWYKIMIGLLDVGAHVHYTDNEQNNVLHVVLDSYSSYHGDMAELLKCVIKLIEAGVDVNHLNKDQQTPIFIAAEKRLRSVVVYLLEHGAHVHWVDKKQDNVLHIVLNGYLCGHYPNTDKNLKYIIKLIEAGVDVNHLNRENETPIFKASLAGLYNVVIYMLERVDCLDVPQNNALLGVLYSQVPVFNRDEFLQCIVKLVEAGVAVNQLTVYKETPVFIAARKRLYAVVLYLLHHGAHVHYVDIKGQNILHCIIRHTDGITRRDIPQCLETVKTLRNMGVNIHKPDNEGNTPLFYLTSQISILRFNYNFTVSINATKCIFNCNLMTVLINAGCDVNHQNKKGQTPLMHHTKHLADISILKLLIPHSDVNLTDNNGLTACSYCVQYREIDCSDIFIFFSRESLMSPNNGVKLFHQILTYKRLELLHYYMRLQLIVSGVTTEGENMLHLLARVKYDYSQDKFNWLFNKKLDINHRCSKTNTPIMVAALLLNSKYLELFTRHPRIYINAQNNQGHTALHLCILGFAMVKDGLNNGHANDVVEDYCCHKYLMYMECVDILLAVGIDVNTPDGKGRTALMMAAMKNDRFLIRKLLNAGAMVNCGGKSALHHLDIYESVFDITFKLLATAVDNMLLNLPCINGNTLIQATLCFPRCWDPRTAVSFVKYLVGENCCLQILNTSSVDSSYNQIDLNELSTKERDELRKLLYLSGAPVEEIVQTLNFEEEIKVETEDIFQTRHQEVFTNYCCNISLMSQCRRIIRQKLGLGIDEKVMDLDLPRELNDFILLKDVLRPNDYYIDNIDDGCNDFDDDDGLGFYDSDKNKDEDYSLYDYQYFTPNTEEYP